MSKRAQPRFRVSEFGQPWIVMEVLDGADLNLSKRLVGFHLPDGTSFEAAQSVARYLNQNLIWVSET